MWWLILTIVATVASVASVIVCVDTHRIVRKIEMINANAENG